MIVLSIGMLLIGIVLGDFLSSRLNAQLKAERDALFAELAKLRAEIKAKI